MADDTVHLQPVTAPWRDHLKDREKQRLAVLDGRVRLKRATLEELMDEKHKIMRRAIARMRRKQGKQK